MKNKDERMSVNKKEDDFYKTDEDYLDESNTCSFTDCTGLIRTGRVEEDELDEYSEIYRMEPDQINLK